MLALLATACLVMAGLLGASNAKAATIGDPVAIDFNYVGLDVSVAALGGISDLVLTPDSALGNLEVRGTYTSTDGAFTVPKVGGLTFPDLVLNVEGGDLTGAIALTEDSTGTEITVEPPPPRWRN